MQAGRRIHHLPTCLPVRYSLPPPTKSPAHLYALSPPSRSIVAIDCLTQPPLSRPSGDAAYLKKRLTRPKHRVEKALIPEALFILRAVNEKYGGSGGLGGLGGAGSEDNGEGGEGGNGNGALGDSPMTTTTTSAESSSSSGSSGSSSGKSSGNDDSGAGSGNDSGEESTGSGDRGAAMTTTAKQDEQVFPHPGDQGYLDSFLGAPISKEEASRFLAQYLVDNKVHGRIAVKWTK
jgi:hypothetical protein